MTQTEESKYELLKEIEPEVVRFHKKLQTAMKQLKKGEGMYQHNDYSAAKRAALDLKRELSKLTKS